MFRRTSFIFLAAVLLLGCSKSSTVGGGENVQLHWLTACTTDDGCGGLSCICGACVAPCAAANSCNVAGVTTTCQQPNAGAPTELCGAPAPKPLCLQPCAAGCAAGLHCVDGACVGKLPPVKDAGTAGSGAAGSGAGSGGSCSYDGQSYAIGASFKSSDGCNDCGCTANGVVCTLRACIQDGGLPSSLTWYRTCGAPVCGPSSDGPTGQPVCTTEQAGAVCTGEGTLCDPSLGCGVNLICAKSDPTTGGVGCPISRARYKADIHYLTQGEVSKVAQQLLATPLASYRYQHDSEGHEQVGFLIDDVEPSPSVEGDHVNLYGYTSMAVAALKVQAEQMQALQSEVLLMRAHLLKLEQRCNSR